MVSAWRSRLIAAHLERWRLGFLEHLLTPVFDTRGRAIGRYAGWLTWRLIRRTAVGRLILLVAAGMAALALGVFAVGVVAMLHALG